MFRCPCLERKRCATASKTVRRVVCRYEAELANKSFESGSEEGRGGRIVGMGRHQTEVAEDGGYWAERRMRDAGQRDDMNSFLMLACLGPCYAQKTARIRELDIASGEVAFTVKG